jgi:hypothetical protein
MWLSPLPTAERLARSRTTLSDSAPAGLSGHVTADPQGQTRAVVDIQRGGHGHVDGASLGRGRGTTHLTYPGDGWAGHLIPPLAPERSLAR